MKSLVIFILVLALAAAAFFTKPSPADFPAYLRGKSNSGGLSLTGMFQGMETENYLHAVTYRNRILWINVQKDGQTQYVGAFSHWFKQAAASAPAK